LVGLIQPYFHSGKANLPPAYALAIYVAVVLAVVVALLRRSELCRWLVILFCFAAPLFLLFKFKTIPIDHRFDYLIQATIKFGAAACLLLPSARRWFVRNDEHAKSGAVV
jgi:hypothetical protein